MIKHILWLNPEPWAIGTVTPRKGGARIAPNANLVAYQSAVKEELEDVHMLPEEYRNIKFYFWRQQARYVSMDDKIRSRNQADATNMQKALEDALQGILFENDREVRKISSEIVEQGYDVEPKILIVAEPYNPLNWLSEVTLDIVREIKNGKPVNKSDNSWPPTS